MTGARGARMRAVLASRSIRLTVRVVAGAGILIAVVAQVGTGPFVHGLLSIDARAIGAALALSAAATAAAAWRWRVIAGRLGTGIRWTEAVGMYYQSQFLNSVLPGGVIGDVRRAVTQGRSARSIPQATRAVVIERTMGQAVQIALTVIVLAWFGVEFEGYLLSALGIGLGGLFVVALASAAASARVRTALRREFDELTAGVGSPSAFVQVVVASIVVVACHVATFGVAVAAVGASVPPPRLAAVVLVVLLAGCIPLNIGGWGPREGAAGWAFGVAGLGASVGVAASTMFGVLAIIAVAPGLVLAVASVVHRDRVPAPSRELALAGIQRKERS